MRIPNQMMIEAGEEPAQWVDRLNKFAQQVISGFSSIKESRSYRDVEVAGTADRFPIVRGLTRPPNGVVLARIINRDEPFKAVATTSFYWSQDQDTVYGQLGGLVTGTLYEIRFLILGGE